MVVAMSLGSKLSIAFVAIAALGILVAGALGIWSAVGFRDRMDFESQAMPLLVDEVLKHYHINNETWKAAEDLVLPGHVLLFDKNRKRLGHAEPGPAHQLVDILRGLNVPATAIVLNGKTVGFLKVTQVPHDKSQWRDGLGAVAKPPRIYPHLGMGNLSDRWPIPIAGLGAILLAAGGSGVLISRRIVKPLQGID